MSSAASPRDPTRERQLLDAFRSGEEDAFEPLVGPYRSELHAHCYRMLGSVHDADDALQDALLRAWRGLDRFEGRSSLRSWLHTIATNASLNLIARRPKRVLPIEHGSAQKMDDGLRLPITESAWIEPYPDCELVYADSSDSPVTRYELRESVELAFVAALQHLPALQRAVLILREVLGFSAREVARTLETTVAAVNSALQRARRALTELLPDRTQQATLRSLGDRSVRELVERYADAMERGDVPAVVGMLTADAAWSMPPLGSWFAGPAIEAFLTLGPLSGAYRWRHLPTTASGQPAIGGYTWHEHERAYLPFALDVLSLREDRIEQVTAFIARSADDDPARFPNWPDSPPDGAMVQALFVRNGLPERI